MKNKILSPLLFAGAAILFIFSSCKKENSYSRDYSAEFNAQIDEQMLISAEIDGITVDAISTAEAAPYFTPGNTTVASICNGNISVGVGGTLTEISITYDGTNCAGLTERNGTVELTLKNNSWLDAKAVLSVKYNNIRIRRIRDNKTIILDGTVDIINESGGGLYNIVNASVTHSIASSDMSVTFEDGIKRPWEISVTRVFSYDRGLVLTTTGNGSAAGFTNISAAGITHEGAPFTTLIDEPMVIRQDCYFRLVSAKLIQFQQAIITIRFGLDASGNATGCPGFNPYFLKATWTGNNKENDIMMPY